MLIGIFSACDDGSFISIADILRSNDNHKVFILDTDDFIIESISCKKLKNLVLKGILDVYNLEKYNDEGVDCLANLSCINNLSDVHLDMKSKDGSIHLKYIRKTIHFKHDLYLNNTLVPISIKPEKESLKLQFGVVDIATISLDDFDVSSLDILSQCSINIGLVYKLSREIIGVVIHLYSSDLDTYCSCTLLVDINGNFIDIICNDPLNVFKRNDNIQNSAFAAKYTTLGKEFFQLC